VIDVQPAFELGMTPLSAASQNGYPEVAKILLDKGAKVNLLDGDEYTALKRASEEGQLEVHRFFFSQFFHRKNYSQRFCINFSDIPDGYNIGCFKGNLA
jgi:hypothetical protein